MKQLYWTTSPGFSSSDRPIQQTVVSFQGRSLATYFPQRGHLSAVLISSLLLLWPTCASSQSTGSQLPQITPPSPTVAALGKYVETPVGTYTGIPNITIPLYEIKVRDITVPITLSYHAGGIRVDEEASWVGLGWSLNAGGAIGCTVREKDDALHVPFNPYPMPVPPPVPEPNDGHFDSRYSEACEVYIDGKRYEYAGAYGDSDWDLDVFSFNFLSYTGQYVLRRQFANDKMELIPHLLAQQKMRVEYYNVFDKTSGNRITTADGTVYEFGVDEVTNVVGNNLGKTTARYLTRITSPQGEIVTFDYDYEWVDPRFPEHVSPPKVYPVSSYTDVHTVRYQNCYDNSAQGDGYTSTAIRPVYLARINFSTGYVVFKRDPVERADLKGGQRLQTIQVFEDGNPVPIREFELGASYTQSSPEFLSTGWGSTNYTRDAAELVYAAKRLRLDQVTERGNGVAKPPHRFAYSATQLPYKTSYQRDHWGYFNGQTSNQSLIPSYEGYTQGFSGPAEYLVVKGADREPNPKTVTAGMLETIQYPTGGTTHFDYEANEYGNLREDEFYSNSNRTVNAEQSAVGVQRTPSTTNVSGSVVVPFTVKATHAHATLSLQLVGQYVPVGYEAARTYVIVRKVDRSYQQVYNYADYGPNSPSRGGTSISLILEPGQYELEACAYPDNLATDQSPPQYLLARGILSWQERLKDTYKKTGPGVRVAKITDHDAVNPANNLVREYKYGKTVEDNGPHPSSTGLLINRPVYWRYKEKHTAESACHDGPSAACPEMIYNTCKSFQLCSYSNMQLQNPAQGSPIGYSEVEEWRGSQASGGKTVFAFANAAKDKVYTVADHIYPGVPLTTDPLNGRLLRKTTYAAQGQKFVKRAETESSYEVTNQQAIPGVVKEIEKPDMYDHDSGMGGFPSRIWCVMPVHFYYQRSQWIQLHNQRERLYDPQDETKFTETTTDYTYDDQKTGHMQVSRTQTKRSDGSTLLTHTTYPADYPQVTNGSLAAMRSDAIYQHSAPVESISQVYGPGQTPADAKVIAGTYTEYAKPTSTSRYLPATISALELAQPKSGFEATAPILPPAGRYVTRQQLAYDPVSANLQQVQRTHDTPTVYVWGYNNTLPVAEIKNAFATQVQAALQGTGLDLSGTLADADLRAAFVQLRQRLPQARVTGFTHQPLIGLTSQTDPAGRTVFYEYDNLGRLVRTRDEKNRILSQQQYHYAGQ